MSLLGLLGAASTAVTLAPYLADDEYGRPTYGAAVTVSPVRVEQHTRQVQLPDMRVVTVTHIVSVPGSLAPTAGDRVTIAGVALRVWTVDTPVWLDLTPMHHKLGVGA